MFFILSKALYFLICPFSWLVFLLIMALIVKSNKLKYRFLWLSVVLLFIFSNPFLLNQFAKRWDIDPFASNNSKPYTSAIILGGFVSKDENGQGFFNSSSDRFLEGVKLQIQGKVSHLLISGVSRLKPVHGKGGDWLLDELSQFRVPDSCILIENASRNTLENVAYSKAILERNHLSPPYLLVTSAYHMRRALFTFKKMGVDVIPYPCDYLAGRNDVSINDFIPDAAVFYKWNIYIKEVIGYAVYYFKV